jgi:exonuclease III
LCFTKFVERKFEDFSFSLKNVYCPKNKHGGKKMKNHSLFGKKVLVMGKRKAYRFKKGIIVGEGDNGYYIVKLEDGRRAWIKEYEILGLY